MTDLDKKIVELIQKYQLISITRIDTNGEPIVYKAMMELATWITEEIKKYEIPQPN